MKKLIYFKNLGTSVSIFIISTSVYADFLVPFRVSDESTKGTGWEDLTKLALWLGTALSVSFSIYFFRICSRHIMKHEHYDAFFPFLSGGISLFAADYFRSLMH